MPTRLRCSNFCHLNWVLRSKYTVSASECVLKQLRPHKVMVSHFLDQNVSLHSLLSLEDSGTHEKDIMIPWGSGGVHSNLLIASSQEATAALGVKGTRQPCTQASVCDNSLCPPKTRWLPGRLCLFLLRACSFGASNWVGRLVCPSSLSGKGQVSVENYVHSIVKKVTLIEMERGESWQVD